MLKNEKILCHYGITLSNMNYEFVKNDYHKYKDKMKAVTFIHSEGIYNKENISHKRYNPYTSENIISDVVMLGLTPTFFIEVNF